MLPPDDPYVQVTAMDAAVSFGGRVPIEEYSEEETSRPCWDRLVITYSNSFRKIWDLVLALLLVYTATIFPYRLSFVQFMILAEDRIPIPIREPWDFAEDVIDYLYVFDFFICFFLSYRDDRDVEVRSLRAIVKHYIKTYFIINLVACMPKEPFDLLVAALSLDGQRSDDSGDLNKASRITRLPRVSRLVRLFRLLRLVKVYATFKNPQRLNILTGFRGLRAINFLFSLGWFVHLFACGWYLCAAMHVEITNTWVYRRETDNWGTRLISKEPWEQWVTSMYFILTVFTTIGLGDVSAYTIGEICYVNVVMVAGAIVHSIVISEVISTIWYVDAGELFKRKRKEILVAFGRHAGLDEGFVRRLTLWSDRERTKKTDFNKEDMWKLVTSSLIPTDMLGRLPEHVFKGNLIKNDFVRVCIHHSVSFHVPPRFPTLLGTLVTEEVYDATDIVYQMNEHPFNIFFVLSGTFAYVALPSDDGGKDLMVRWNSEEVGTSSTSMSVLRVLPKLARLRSTESLLSNVSVSSKISKKKKLDLSPRHLFARRSESRILNDDALQPYQLFSARSYFGDIELLSRRSQRAESARCEAKGTTLVLHKSDLAKLAEEFPQYKEVWKVQALRREERRLIRLESHTVLGLTYRVLAVLQLQNFYRTVWGKVDRGMNHSRRVAPKRSRTSAVHGTKEKELGMLIESLRLGMSNLKRKVASVDLLQEDIRALREDIRGAIGAVQGRVHRKMSV